MEPPPKRLRILQSVEVDESSPDYIAAKQKQQERFKGTLESIFAKYGNMHESQSDEIDMKDGKVVVNRGHLRRAARHGTLTASNLLNSVAAGDVPDIGEESDDEGDNEDSEDELAPTQPIKSSAQKDNHSKRVVPPPQAAISSPTVSTPVPFQAQTPRTAPGPMAQMVPFTPDPAANLLQQIQFPQTPAGQQAQTSFYAALTQTINQAVQQAVAPLFSSILPSTSIAPSPLTNVLPLQATRAETVDTLAAARDPKWFFPPLPEHAREKLAARCRSVSKLAKSSPPLDVAEQQEQLVEGDDVAHEGACVRELPEQNTISIATLVRSQEPADKELRNSTRRLSPRVQVRQAEKRQRTGRSRKSNYVFTEDEEICIAKMKTLQGFTWEQIKKSNDKWIDWPLSAFQQRYYKRWKAQDLHLRKTPELGHPGTAQEDSELEHNAFPSHHLPTPSSLEQECSDAYSEAPAPATVEHLFSSSTHFDDDERDLLSLASDDLANEQLQFESAAEDFPCPDADETILPSIEWTDLADDKAIEQGPLEDPLLDGACPEAPVVIKQEPIFSSPSNTRKRPRLDVSYQAPSDTESQAGDNDNADDASDYHETNEHPTPRRPQRKSPSLDLVGEEDDPLQVFTPTTTTIKREFSTPFSTNLLFRTPAPKAQTKIDYPSSGIKSASGQSRRKLYNDSKRAWAKKTPAGKTMRRKSLHTEPRGAKRRWGDVEAGNREREESVDPLAY